MKVGILKKASLAIAFTLVLGTSLFAFSGLKTSPSAAPRTSAEILNSIPDADGVLIVNLQNLLNSSLFNLVKDAPGAKIGYGDFENQAREYGLELSQIQTAALGFPKNFDGRSEPKMAVILSGGINRDTLLNALNGRPDKFAVKSEAYGNDTVYIVNSVRKSVDEPASDKPKVLTNADFQGKSSSSDGAKIRVRNDEVALAFLAADTVAVGDKSEVLRVLDVRAGKGASVASNEKLVRAFRNAGESSAVRFAGVVPVSLRAKMQDEVQKGGPTSQMMKPFMAVTSYFGNLDFDDGMRMDTTLNTASSAESKAIYDQLNGLLMLGKMGVSNADRPENKVIADMLNQISVTDRGGDVQVSINIPEASLKAAMNEKKPKAQ